MSSKALDSGGYQLHQEHIPISRNFLLMRSVLAEDIINLLEQCVKLRSADFSAFWKVWEKHQFLGIHLVCIDKDVREGFMNELYACMMKYLPKHTCYHMRVCVVYSLYAVYLTQPDAFPRYKIQATPLIWQALRSLCEAAKEKNDRDVVYVINDLLLGKCAVDLVPYNSTLDEYISYLEHYDSTGRFPTREELYEGPLTVKKMKHLDRIETKIKLGSRNNEVLEGLEDCLNELSANYAASRAEYERMASESGLKIATSSLDVNRLPRELETYKKNQIDFMATVQPSEEDFLPLRTKKEWLEVRAQSAELAQEATEPLSYSYHAAENIERGAMPSIFDMNNDTNFPDVVFGRLDGLLHRAEAQHTHINNKSSTDDDDDDDDQFSDGAAEALEDLLAQDYLE